MQIGVIGHDSRASEKALSCAYEAGKEIARQGHVLICGGRGGIMEQACRGCSEEGGTGVGILPSADGSDANPHVKIQIRTGMGFGRNSLVALSSDVLIVIGGGSGTLCEICFAWQTGKKIIALEGTGGVADQYAGKSLDGKRTDKIIPAKSAEEAVALALKS